MTDRLMGSVAIVTGAGSAGPGWGIGKASAVQLAREGARVLAVDIDAQAVAETRALIEDAGGICETFIGDVSVAAHMDAMVAACLDAFGDLHVLVNNVAAAVVGGLEDTSEQDFDRLMRVNVKSMFLACRAAVPVMTARYSEDRRVRSIVNIGAVAGHRWTGVPMLAYAVSKGAIEPFTRSVALEYARSGIRCNGVVPGLMDTPFVVKAMTAAGGEETLAELMASRDNQAPVGKMGTGWDVAHAAAFLASADSDYITGQMLVVDGGQSAQTCSPLVEDLAVGSFSGQ